MSTKIPGWDYIKKLLMAESDAYCNGKVYREDDAICNKETQGERRYSKCQ